jgi:hypothetical protein
MIHKHIKSIWNKEGSPYQWKEYIIVPIQKKGGKTDCKSPCINEIIGGHQCGFQQTDQLLIRVSAITIGEKNASTMRQYISYSWTSRKPPIQ